MTVRKLIGPPSLWTEPFPELVVRWHKRLPEEKRDEVGSASMAAQRATERARRVLDYSTLESAPVINSARQWETRWDCGKHWKRLVEHLRARDCEVIYDVKGSGHGVDLSTSALRADDAGQTILLLEQVLIAQRDAARAGRCPLPLTVDDMAVIGLAREVFAIEAQRIGRPPKAAWVDELAPTEFARLLLGLPFSPLVFQLLRKA